MAAIYGTNGPDTLPGTAGDDTIYGWAPGGSEFTDSGNDSITGGGSGTFDLIFGGGGNDTLRGQPGNAHLFGQNGNDLLIGSDSLDGGAGNDTIFGHGATIDGGEGNDFIRVSGFASVEGGAGTDTLDFSNSPSGVGVQLGNSSWWHGIEKLVGSQFDDTLRSDNDAAYLDGGAGADWIFGQGGDDTLRGSFGADTLDGGAGIDTATYSASPAGIIVSLANGQGTGADAQGDSLIGIENLIGSDFSDTLTGTVFANRLEGGAAGDSLDGGGSPDTLIGGAGADTLNGGAGGDTADYSASAYGVKISLITGTKPGGDGTGDVLIGIENLVGSAFQDSLGGDSGRNTLEGGAGADTLDGAGGIDTANYARSSLGVNVSLATHMGQGGDAAGDSLTGIENLVGSAFSDSLGGDGGDNTLEGGRGADTLDGAGGIDTADYSRSSLGVNVSLVTHMGQGGDATGDSLTGIENLTGSAFNDSLTGDGGANLLIGNSGDDSLIGGAGTDTVDGGDGVDVLSYAGSAAGVGVSLVTHHGQGGDAAGDSLLGIEHLIGSGVSDVLIGDGAENRFLGGGGGDSLSGGLGNDTLLGGAGPDTMDGGGGLDAASYDGSLVGVRVSLSTHHGTAGDATGDSLIGIENLTGSAFGDVLVGDAFANRLSGRDGPDSLFGADGNDTLYGGAGADALNGGPGVDTADYSGSPLGVNVSLTTHQGTAGDAVGDTLVGIENLDGSAYSDVLIGDDLNNSFSGGGGADSLAGGDGNDTIAGGAGADTLDGGQGVNTLDYSGSSAGVTVLLFNGSASGGDAPGYDHINGFQNVFGSALNDDLVGDNQANDLHGLMGADTLFGLDGNDTLSGGQGEDALVGGAGNDTLIGQPGNDTLTGGADADHFVVAPGGGLDRVTDFHHAEQDKLDLTAFHFASAADALSHAVSSGGNTYFDLDGDPNTHEITLLGVASVDASDVLV